MALTESDRCRIGVRAENRERWRTHVLAQQRGSLNQRQYCEKHALSFSSFTRWRRLLLGAGKRQAVANEHGFVPLRIEPTPVALISDDDQSPISLVLPGGVRIEGITHGSVHVALALAAAL